MARRFTGREQEWIFDHGFKVSDAGLIEIPLSKWRRLQWTGNRISDPRLRTLVIPSDNGMCLLTEGMHFEIIGG